MTVCFPDFPTVFVGTANDYTYVHGFRLPQPGTKKTRLLERVQIITAYPLHQAGVVVEAKLKEIRDVMFSIVSLASKYALVESVRSIATHSLDLHVAICICL